MAEQKAYLTKMHERLLNYAAWAKYVAWVVLVVFAAGAVLSVAGQLNMTNAQLTSFGSPALSFPGLLSQYPSLAISVLFAGLRTFFQGAVYFLVLKAVSVGLLMIAETDVNYRDRLESAE